MPSEDAPPEDTNIGGALSSARPRSVADLAWRVLRVPLAAYLVIVILMMFFEEQLIYIPTPYDGGEQWRPAGLDYQDVEFQAGDGTRLHGWYCPHESPRAIILYSHGNAGNLASRVDIVRRLQRMGLSTFLYDYRGYGRSEGSPNEEGVLQDARAARAKLAELAAVEESEIVMMGRSLGGAVAIDLAAKDGARGLVVESTFTSLPDVGKIHYPWLPVGLLMRNRFDSIDKIRDYHGRLLQSHGDADSMIPFELGRRLYDASPLVDGEEKHFFALEKWDHNDRQPPAYYEQLGRFIDSLP